MQRTFILTLLSAGATLAQVTGNFEYKVSSGSMGFASSVKPVQGAPYSATITNESVQTLADGNRIIQKSTGTTARDSMGRTRNDTVLPMIGNMSAAKPPHLVFIVDPIAQTSYTLNLEEKTAQKGGGGMGFSVASGVASAGQIVAGIGPGVPSVDVLRDVKEKSAIAGTRTFSSFAYSNGPNMRMMASGDQGEIQKVDLGIQTMEGVAAQGFKTIRTIPAGEIGNEKPIEITTEVWTSPDLKTVVYSKRSDPRMGDQIFRLTNIQRSEPDASLFTVPSDFKITESDVFFYKARE